VVFDELDPLQEVRVFGHLVVKSSTGFVVLIWAAGAASEPVAQEDVLKSVLRQLPSKELATELGREARGRMRAHIHNGLDSVPSDEG
jgi:hypothetical protein